MLYTVANFAHVADHVKGLGPDVDGSVDVSAVGMNKTGRRQRYPGGLVFTSKGEAVDSLQRVIMYEYDPAGPYAKMKEMEARLFELEGDRTDCYLYRGGLRLRQDQNINRMLPEGGMRYAFTSATMRWDQAEDFMKEVEDVFSGEPWLRNIIPDIGLEAEMRPASAKTCFIIEGPLTRQHLLGKLKLAG
jgi:hypothetical protein